ncbi:MAG: NeuD/PglB/VioB family sugar acetyltransferase [Planctomycetaceae bacterium]
MRNLAIIGGTDLGQQIAAVARAHGGYRVAGFIDDFQEPGTPTAGGPVLGRVDDIQRLQREGTVDALLIGVGYKHPAFRRACFERFATLIDIPTLVHPAAHLEPTSSLGRGTVVGAGCVVDGGVSVAENCYFNPGCVIAHDTSVGANCFFGPGVTLAGFITIGEDCFLGVGTTVIDNLTIAAGTQTGGGTLVCSDITEPALYVGNPARRLRDRR